MLLAKIIDSVNFRSRKKRCACSERSPAMYSSRCSLTMSANSRASALFFRALVSPSRYFRMSSTSLDGRDEILLTSASVTIPLMCFSSLKRWNHSRMGIGTLKLALT